MRAAFRCTEHYQGQRCQLAAAHDGSHRGEWHEWGIDGVKQRGILTSLKAYRWIMRKLRYNLTLLKAGVKA
jgi:hypothetical protein